MNIREKAEQWMDDNPKVYELFLRFAREKLERGQRFGIGALTERVRWECSFAYDGEYKIANAHRAYIARRLVRDIPEVADLIRLKPTRY